MLGALVSSGAVAIVTIMLSNGLAHARDDADLRGVAGMLGYALTVKGFEPEQAALDQLQEHAHAGIAVAVFAGERRVAGDAAIPRVAPETCANTAQTHACAVAAGKWVAIAARDRAPLRELEGLSIRAATVAVILTSLLSALAALALAKAAVSPLERLARAVQGVPVLERGEAALGPSEGVREVDGLRATLQSAFDQQARALAQSRSFAEQAAHKLRDPLATMVSELDCAAADIGAPGAEECARARRIALRLTELVDRLLILANPRDAVSFKVTTTLTSAVRQAVETLPEAARARVLSSGPEVAIPTDPALLVSAIVSALENALKYSSGPVQARVEPHDDAVVLAIEDDGPGVSEAEREQVFLPFVRGQGARTGQIPGHGIGLAVIARVAEMHAGSARFAVREQGARLEIRFPTQRAQPVQRVEQPQPRAAARPAPWKPRTLAQRVFSSTALGSLLAVAIVAPVTVILANRLARNQEDEHLRSAARTLAFELQVKHYDPRYAVADEIRELAQTAIVVALFEQGRLLAGKPEVPFVRPDGCRNKAHMRACALAVDRWVVVAARAHTRLRAHADVTLLAAGVAVIVTGVLSLILAHVLAAAAIRPLDKLSRALRHLPQDPRETADLGPASDVHEVETLRASLHGVFETLRRALLLSHSFAGDAAHQLRTPLAALTAEVDLALEVVDKRARPYCLRAHAEATKLSRLIDRLLILAMPEDTIRAWVAVSSAELFEDALEALAEAQRARIDCSGQVGFEADPILLTTALVAVLEHALRITTGRLQLHAELEHEHARLVIACSVTEAASSGDDDMWRAVWQRVAMLHGGRERVQDGQITMIIPRARSGSSSILLAGV